jgi:selenophosphate synthase
LDYERLVTLSTELGRNALRLLPNHYSYFYCSENKYPEIIRRVYKIDENIRSEDLKTKKAISIMKWEKNIVNNSVSLVNEIKRISEPIKTKIEIDKASIIPTNSTKDFQFTLFDHIKPQRGNRSGYTIVTSSNTQATDINQDIDSEIHIEIAFTESINLLSLLGCSADIRLFPIYDAPNEENLDKIRKDIDKFSAIHNYVYDDYSSLKLNSLFYGTTASGNIYKEIPNKYDMVKEDTQIIITDKVGLLSYLSLYSIASISEKFSIELKSHGIDENSIKQLKDLCIKNMTQPKALLGKTISKFLPSFEDKFDAESHILVTHPLSKNGISSLEEISELTNSELIIDEIPLVDPDIANFMAKELIISNPTASTSNTNIILASSELSQSILDELSKSKFNPKKIGRVGKKGERRVTFRNRYKKI